MKNAKNDPTMKNVKNENYENVKNGPTMKNMKSGKMNIINNSSFYKVSGTMDCTSEFSEFVLRRIALVKIDVRHL